MRFLLRTLILLLLVFWVGSSMFFPIVAASAFSVLPVHDAGLVVGKSLKTLNVAGLIVGAFLILFLVIAQRTRAFARNVIAPILLVVAMMGLTAFSQFSIIPRMDNDIVDAGGRIEAVPPSNPYRRNFTRLHHESVTVFGGALVGGILTVIAVGWAASPGEKSQLQP